MISFLEWEEAWDGRWPAGTPGFPERLVQARGCERRQARPSARKRRFSERTIEPLGNLRRTGSLIQSFYRYIKHQYRTWTSLEI